MKLFGLKRQDDPVTKRHREANEKNVQRGLNLGLNVSIKMPAADVQFLISQENRRRIVAGSQS